MRKPLTIFCFFMLLFCLPSLRGQNLKELIGKSDELSITADHMDADVEKGVAHAKGNVKIQYGQLTVKANEASLNQDTKDFTAKGDVVVSLDDGTSWAAQAVSGNLATNELSFGEFGFDGKVWHSGGSAGSNDKEGHKMLKDAWISTCDRYPNPHYRLSASEIHHYEDNTFTAKHIVIRLGVVPIFYFPYMIGTTDGTAGMIIKPGYSGKRGAYLQLGRIWKLAKDDKDADGEARVFVDLMSKRGIGAGSKLDYVSEKQEINLNLYGLLDEDPPETEDGFNRRFHVTDDRYRLNWYHRYNFSDELTLRANVDWLSDIDMLEDWFKHEYRQISQPKTFLSLDYEGDWYHAGISARPRVNDFYTVVEKLPEATFDIPRIGIGKSPLEYQSSSSMGYYYMKWRDFDRKRFELLEEDYDPDEHLDPRDYKTFRADTSHFIYLPLDYNDLVEFIPRAGVKATYYSRSSKIGLNERDLADMLDVDNADNVYSKHPVRHYDVDGGEVFRAAYEVGFEAKSRFFSDWMPIQLEAFESEGLRHVIEPYINYTYSPDPSHDRKYLYFFDETDRLERQHFIRFGIDQRIQTRRNGRAETLLRWQTYADLHFDRGIDNYGDDIWRKGTGNHGGDFGNRIDFMPTNTLHTWATVLYDMGEGDIQRGEVGTRLGREDYVNLTMRYVYRNDHISRSTWSLGSTLVDLTGESSYYKKYFETSDTIRGKLNIPLNQKTSFEIEMEYDFDKHRMSEHYYTLRRELHCWVVSLGAGWDNNEFEVMIMLHLTSFPKVKIDLNL